MSQELEKISSSLVNPTFFEGLHAKQELVKKEFFKLKKIDAYKKNQEKLQRRLQYLQQKLRQGENRDKYMVFNYLWHRFPEVMATKNQDPQLLRQEIECSEFEKILKTARRFYGFRASVAGVVAAGSVSATIFSTIFITPHILIFGIPFSIFTIMLASAYPITSYFNPDDRTEANSDKRKKLQELYQNTQKKNE